MKKIEINPLLPKATCPRGVSPAEFERAIPEYLRQPCVFDCGWARYKWLNLAQFFIQTGIRLFLRPRKGIVGNLNREEVKLVYDLEAGTYDGKHHFTTHGMDTTWRRQSGWVVQNVARVATARVSVLDICTGTGLTVKEIALVLSELGLAADIIGLDYNERMLECARRRTDYRNDVGSIKFVRGDAMNLAGQFNKNSFDVITQMFGIGGISNPLLVFDGVLSILKPGGQYFLIDMHRPIASQPGEWPFFFKWFRFPRLEAMTYQNTTIPLALNRLWGWRDTTLDFYFLPLVVSEDADGQKWGFEVVNFEVESQRWWFGLPIMPVARITVRKSRITEEVVRKRQAILKACTQ